MSHELVEHLEQWKTRHSAGSTEPLERLLARIGRTPITEPLLLIRLHEALLFLRAYPQTGAVARLVH